MTETRIINQDLWQEAMHYNEYKALIERLLMNDKTTGPEQSEKLVEYTQLNFQRMERLDKTLNVLSVVKGDLSNLKESVKWLVLTEAWCGDAAQLVPVMNKLAEETNRLEMRLILRDDHPEVMDQFLTDGSRSIPKLIMLDDLSLDPIASWGPRPEILQEYVLDALKKGRDFEKIAEYAQQWYNDDEGKTAQIEIVQTLKETVD